MQVSEPSSSRELCHYLCHPKHNLYDNSTEMKLDMFQWLIALFYIGPGLCFAQGCVGETISIVAWYFPPFVYREVNDSINGAMFDLLKDVVESCCGNGTTIKVATYAKNPAALESQYAGNITIILPVSRDFLLQELFSEVKAYKYLPILSNTGPVFLVHGGRGGHLDAVLLGSVAASWPLAATALGMAGLTAMVIWALECRCNSKQFPRKFHKGSASGMWWALVTMTTVGYGDLTPVTIVGRIVSVLWMVIGIVLMSVFTATLSAAFSGTTTHTTSDLRGLKVAVLEGSQEYLVAFSNGATPVVADSYDTLLVMAKTNHTIDGILVDRYFALFYTSKIEKMGLLIGGSMTAFTSVGVLIRYDYTRLISCLAGYVVSRQTLIYNNIEIDETKKYNPAGQTVSNLMSNTKVFVYILLASVFAVYLIVLLLDVLHHQSHVKRANLSTATNERDISLRHTSQYKSTSMS